MDVAVAGASEAAINYGSMRAWQAMRVLSPDGCYPFSKRRNGTVLGEGAGILVLEEMEHARARGATVLAELMGFGMTSDASDMVNPDMDGPTRAMQIALADARPCAGRHRLFERARHRDGRERHQRDARHQEGVRRARKQAFRILHEIDARPLPRRGGGVEAAVCVQAMREGFVPATIGFDEPGNECDLDYTPNEGRYREIGYAMSNSFAFGGLECGACFWSAPKLTRNSPALI